MSCGKVEEPSSSRRRFPSTARFAATSAILTVTLSRSDKAPISSTANAFWPGARLWLDSNLRRVRRGAGGRNDEVAVAEALANWVALHKLRVRETDSISKRRTK